MNLSTNLVGVDQTILKLEAPLIDIHADINIISQSLDSEVQLIAEKLELRSQIRNKEVSVTGVCVYYVTYVLYYVIILCILFGIIPVTSFIFNFLCYR